MEHITAKFTLPFTTAIDHLHGTIHNNGVVVGYTLVLPNFTTAASAILTILDPDGYTVYTGDSKNDNGTVTVMSMTGLAPVEKGSTITLTLNDVSGGAHSATVKLYII